VQKAAPKLQPLSAVWYCRAPYIIHRLRIRQPPPGCLLIKSTDGHKDRTRHLHQFKRQLLFLETAIAMGKYVPENRVRVFESLKSVIDSAK